MIESDPKRALRRSRRFIAVMMVVQLAAILGLAMENVTITAIGLCANAAIWTSLFWQYGDDLRRRSLK